MRYHLDLDMEHRSSTLGCYLVGLNGTGEYSAARFSHLNYSLSVRLPWQDFDPLGQVSLPALTETAVNESAALLEISAVQHCTDAEQRLLPAVTTVGNVTALPMLKVRSSELVALRILNITSSVLSSCDIWIVYCKDLILRCA